MLLLVLTILAAYLIGSIPVGYLVGRMRGVDLFQVGSGNIGATNVGRVLGKKYGILVFVLDFAKGAGPVFLASWLVQQSALAEGLSNLPEGSLQVAAGLAAFLGHLFPIYLGFRGGKGVATGAGVVSVLAPAATLTAVVVWILLLLASRYVSLASLGAAIALVVGQVLSFGLPPTGFAQDPRSWFCLVAAGLVIIKHRSNIARLAQGRENRVKEGPSMFALTKSVHVLALGLWFGSTVFFSFIAAPTLFSRFEALAQKPALERKWFPPAPEFAKHDDTINGPREQGTRAAGYAVGPLFPILFLLQGVCGFAAIATALPWMRLEPTRRVHSWRVTVILAALCCVLASWPLESKVRELQGDRHSKTLVYLLTDSKSPELETARDEMREARSAFGRWHGVSLILNLVTIALATASMVLAAFLPARNPELPRSEPQPESPSTRVSHEMPTEALDK